MRRHVGEARASDQPHASRINYESCGFVVGSAWKIPTLLLKGEYVPPMPLPTDINSVQKTSSAWGGGSRAAESNLQRSPIPLLFSCFLIGSWERCASEQVNRSMGVAAKPKTHQLAHMAFQIREWGSPTAWGCYSEEGLNRWLARVANSAHRAVWHRRVLNDFRSAYGIGKRKRARGD